jgi:hypothetical protein
MVWLHFPPIKRGGILVYSNAGIFKQSTGARNRVGTRNRVVVQARQPTQPGGIGSLESILGFLKSLKIRALSAYYQPSRLMWPKARGLAQHGGRPPASWSRVTKQGVILFVMDGRHHLSRGLGLIRYRMCTEHPKKAWASIL